MVSYRGINQKNKYIKDQESGFLLSEKKIQILKEGETKMKSLAGDFHVA